MTDSCQNTSQSWSERHLAAKSGSKHFEYFISFFASEFPSFLTIRWWAEKKTNAFLWNPCQVMNILTPSLSQYPNVFLQLQVTSIGRLLHQYPYMLSFFLSSWQWKATCIHQRHRKKMNDLVARTTSLSLAFCSSVGHFSPGHSRGFSRWPFPLYKESRSLYQRITRGVAIDTFKLPRTAFYLLSSGFAGFQNL